MSDALPWLVVIDMQHAFADPDRSWSVEGYAEVVPVIDGLVARFGARTVFTRFVRDPAEEGQWAEYYDTWQEYRRDPTDSVWDLTLDVPPGRPVITESTFSKWRPALQAVVGDAPLVLCGVATECCVMSTAYAAADAGREVRVVWDACAGATRVLHAQALTIMGSNAPLITVATSHEL